MEYLFRIKFKGEFNFQEFIIFDRELYKDYDFKEIRFHPDPPIDVFKEQHLTHISPTWSVGDPNGFVFVWKKYKNIVRKVSFDQFDKTDSENRKIRMTINLNSNFISLDMAKGISTREIKRLLENSFGSNLVEGSGDETIDNTTKATKIIGILNKGKNSKFIDNSFIGLDVGIQDEGENTYASGNEFLGKFSNIGRLEIIKGDKIEQYGDKNKVETNKSRKKEGLFSMNKPIIYFIVLLSLYVTYTSLIYFFPNFFK